MAKVKVEKDLYQRAVSCAQEMGYSSVDEFAEHLLEQAVREHESQKEEDKAAVEERLRGLGYIE